MKIIHVVESYGGGVFTSVNQLCNGFAKDNDVLLVHGVRDETPADFATALAPRVRALQIPFTREIRPAIDLQSLRSLIQLFRTERPDVVHLHSSKAGFLGRLAAALVGCRAVVYSPRAFAFLDPAQSKLKKRLYFLLEYLGARTGGVVVGCSRDEAKEATAVAKRVVQINNSIDVRFIESLEQGAARRNPNKPLTVGVHARVTDAKRPGLFLEVARLVRRARPDIRFLWIGGGEPYFVDNKDVECTGWLSRPEALTAVSREVDVYLLTSAYEGLPLSVIEAAAMGKPSVCTAVSGTRSAVVDGYSGFLCNDLDAVALASAVLRLAADDDLRTTMGRQARALARKEFDTPLMLARYRELYEALVSSAAAEAAHVA